jgi:hypothetical protein
VARAQQQWTLITQNGVDFQMLQRAWLLWGVPQAHPGILVFRTQVPAALAPQAAHAVADLIQQGVVLPNRLHQLGATGWVPYP